MSESTTIVPPAPTPAPATPTSRGIDSLIETKFAAPVEMKPEVKSAPPTPEPPKPGDKPPGAAAKPDAPPLAKPAAKKDFEDAEVEKERKANPNHKAWKILDSIKAKHATQEAAWKAEKAALESRPQTAANDERISQLEKLIAERDGEAKTLRQRLEEADFTRSEAYNTQFVIPYNNEWKRAIEEVKGLTITLHDKNGDPQTRPANENDFQYAMSLRGSAQDEFISKAFGHSAFRIIARINEINRIRAASEQAVSDHAAKFEKLKAERELQAKRDREEFDRDFQASHKEYQADPEFGKYISESEDDPDGTRLLKAELETFDNYQNTLPQMTTKERAKAMALVRTRYGESPRLRSELKKERAKTASLQAELAKLRGADPGKEVKTVTGGAPPEKPKGVDAMLQSLKWSDQA